MSRTIRLYKPQDLNEILSLIEDNLGSVNMDPLVRAGRLVQVLHDSGWIIVKMDRTTIADPNTADIPDKRVEQLKESIEKKYGKL